MAAWRGIGGNGVIIIEINKRQWHQRNGAAKNDKWLKAAMAWRKRGNSGMAAAWQNNQGKWRMAALM